MTRSCETCRHRERAPAVCDVPAYDTTINRPVNAYLCLWADAHPERFVDAPRWLTHTLPVIHGHLIDGLVDNCPAWQSM